MIIMKITKSIILLALTIFAIFLWSCSPSVSSQIQQQLNNKVAQNIQNNNSQNSQTVMDFQGRYLVSISDADMVASAYVDGQLGPREGSDALSVIPLQGDYRSWKAREVVVSNSVAGPPTAVDVSPDGRWAFVVESFSQASENAATFSDLTVGNSLTVVDLNDPNNPKVRQRINIGKRPESVNVSPKGDYIAVTLHPPGERKIALVPFSNGNLGKPSYYPIPGIDAEERGSHAEWHPSGNYLAVTLVNSNRVIFLRVSNQGNSPLIEPWGEPIIVSKYPFMGRFTPDGRHFLVVNLYWGSDVEGTWTEAPRGDVMSIRMATETTSDGNINHRIVSKAETSISPEGIAISPDGRYIVTTNLERSYLPKKDSRITMYSSLTLLQIDPKTGQIETFGDYNFDGILPEAATFDASGNFVAVVNYDHFDDNIPGGTVDFWRLVKQPEPKLIKLNYSVRVTRGPHSMVLVP